jgi:CheY-like chemotaxis protein
MYRSLLFVEDDEDDIFAIKRILGRMDVRASDHSERNGKAAVEYLNSIVSADNAHATQFPHLIFLDLNMPLMNGLEFLRWLRSQPNMSTIPVVVLTSSANPSDIQLAYQSGANAYLVKPTSSEKFSNLLSAAQSFWLEHNQYVD